MSLFKKCPSCGKRFGVSSEGKKLMDTQMETEETTSAVLVRTGSGRNAGTGNPVTSSVKVTIERMNYETSYRCSKCGHAWAENSTVLDKT